MNIHLLALRYNSLSLLIKCIIVLEDVCNWVCYMNEIDSSIIRTQQWKTIGKRL